MRRDAANSATGFQPVRVHHRLEAGATGVMP